MSGVARVLALAAAALLVALPLLPKNGAYGSTKHGDPANGVSRRPDRPRGSCAQCHDEHASHDSLSRRGNGPAGLFAPDDNDLCFVCHSAPSESGMFPGASAWAQSAHAVSSSMLRTGSGGRAAADINKCVNCHDPHGVRDNTGVIPAMLNARESDLCVSCHNGSRAPDIRSQLSRPYRHAITTARSAVRVVRAAGSVTCSDCHNVHVVPLEAAPPSAPEASSRLAGVSRVSVVNGGGGSPPAYRLRTATDAGIANEYEICFRCHSSYVKQAPGATDLALLTNPANASYHPIQSAGKNARIDRDAFVNGFTSQSLVRCTDCHTSDDPTVRGPHGSSYRYILKKPTTATTMAQPMGENDICFDCHAYAVYADAKSAAATLRASRFNGPNDQGHAFHVGAQHIPCYGCHETHGSRRTTALIAVGRLPGISSYVATPSGGTCMTSCHPLRSYSINYPR